MIPTRTALYSLQLIADCVVTLPHNNTEDSGGNPAVLLYMTIQLLNCGSDPRVINKTYSLIAETTATPFGEITIVDPILRIRRQNELSGINYIYVPEWLRYYFVNDIRIISGDIMELSCHIDVLNSFKSAILDSECICIRSERTDVNPRTVYTQNGTYINDTQRPIYPYVEQTAYAFSAGDFNLSSASNLSRNFVLNVSGGDGE